MTAHEVITTVVGLLIVLGAPAAWRCWKLDGFIALILFLVGLSVVVTGRM